MTPLDRFLDQAWADHGSEPDAVAARLAPALSLVTDEAGVSALAHLAHHVLGEHLGRWPEGLAFLDQLGDRHRQGTATTAALARYRASLRLAGRLADDRGALPASDACRVTAMAAACLCLPDAGRSRALLEDAQARAAALDDADPGVRALAANANNIAAALAEHAGRSPAQRGLMLQAAETGRMQWGRAGTWKETERAEYRLALCWLAAGDATRALQHGRLCDNLVRENGSEPLEVFFAGEALALPARALGDWATHDAAVAMARTAFDALSPDDQGWCRQTLQRLTG